MVVDDPGVSPSRTCRADDLLEQLPNRRIQQRCLGTDHDHRLSADRARPAIRVSPDRVFAKGSNSFICHRRRCIPSIDKVDDGPIPSLVSSSYAVSRKYPHVVEPCRPTLVSSFILDHKVLFNLTPSRQTPLSVYLLIRIYKMGKSSSGSCGLVW
jgi:hypothetical protein